MGQSGQLNNMMKLVSWNVNGLRAVNGKGFSEIFASLDADFFCLQETKMQAGQLELEFPGYKSFWNFAQRKGYSGTAVYTKHEPLSVSYGIGISEHDTEGRVITLEMQDFFLVCVYVPNSQDELKRLDYRMVWEDAFRAYLLGLHQTTTMPDSLIRKEENSQTFSGPDSSIHSDISTRTRRTYIPGGHTVSGHVKGIQAGVSTIFLFLRT